MDLLRSVLRGNDPNEQPVADLVSLTPSQRRAIQKLSAASKAAFTAPEACLVSFKEALDHAANNAHLPLGPERNVLLSRFVRLFIEELYRPNGDEAVAEDSACRGRTPNRIEDAFADR